MKTRKVQEFLPEVITLQPSVYPEDWNEDIVETAGFIPLEVRFKQMEQAGFRAQFFESEFSSKDVTDMYLNHPEFDITPEDDVEDAYEKMQLRAAYIRSVKEAVRARNAELEKAQKESEIEGHNGTAGTEQPKTKAKKEEKNMNEE